MAMVKSGRINRLVISLIPLILVAALLFPNSFGASQVPAQEGYQYYLPLLSFTPRDVYYEYLTSIGGSDTLFYVADQLAFLGRGHQLVILDVSTPSHPVLLTSVNLPAPPEFLVVRDGYGFLALGNAGFGVLDLRQPAQAYLLYRLPLDGFSQHVLLSDQAAFVSSDQSVYVVDISQPASPHLVSSIPMYAKRAQFHDSLLLVFFPSGFTFYDISDLKDIIEVSRFNFYWGSLIAVSANHIYFQSSACGIFSCAYWLDIIDISDPYTPFKSGTYQVMSDYTHIIFQGDTAYIGDGWNVEVAHITPDGGFDTLGNYHFGAYIEFLQLDRGKLYLGGNNSIEILDVNDPVNIIQVGKYTSSTYAIKSSQIKLPFIYAQVNLIGGLSDAVSMLVFDVTDPKLPTLVNDTAYSSLNIEPVFEPYQIYLDGERMYVTASIGGDNFSSSTVGIRIFDLQQPVAPVALADYLPVDPEGGAGVSDASLHNSVEIRNSIGYIVTSWGNLLVVDFSDPLAPVVLSRYSANASTVRVIGDHAYLISREDEDPNTSLHLLILDVSDPSNPILLSDYVYASFPDAYDTLFDVSRGIAYLGLPGALRLLDVSDPTNPTELGELPLDSEDYPRSVNVEGDLAVISIENRVEIIDISTPLTPIRLADIELPYVRSIEIHDPFVFLVGREGAYVLDIAQPEQPHLFLHYPGYATSIAGKSNNLVYVARPSDGLEIYRFYPPGFSIE
jgi:hypothetical protein